MHARSSISPFPVITTAFQIKKYRNKSLNGSTKKESPLSLRLLPSTAPFHRMFFFVDFWFLCVYYLIDLADLSRYTKDR